MSMIFTDKKQQRTYPRKCIALVLPNISQSAHDCLTGILRYSLNCSRWDILPLTQSDPLQQWSLLQEFNVDALFIRIDLYASLLTQGLDPNLPAVLLDTGDSQIETPWPRIRIDSAAAGRTVARYVARKPVSSIALLGPRARDGSFAVSVYTAFKEALHRLRPELSSPEILNLTRGCFDNHSFNRQALQNYLREAPKPCFILAFSDWLAWNVILIAHELGLDVPSQVMVMGMDNDLLLCKAAQPQISSLAPDYSGAGFLAGKAMARLLWADRRIVLNRIFTFKAETIVERDSTVDHRGSGRIIQRATEFIRNNCTTPLSVEDVARALQVSKRTLNLHFSRTTEKSVHNVILAARLEKLLKLLQQSNISIRAATELSGFPSERRIKDIFRMRFKMTMSEYRHNYHAQSSISAPNFQPSS